MKRGKSRVWAMWWVLLSALSAGVLPGLAWGAQAVAAEASASAPVMAMAWWRDPAGTAELPDVPRQPFQPFLHAISMGNTEDAVWIRLDLPPLAASTDPWMLLLQPAMLQEAALFVPDADGQWQRQPLGLAHAFAKRPVATLNLAYPVEASEHPQRIYIRLKTVTSAFQAQLMPASQVHGLDAAMHGWIGLYGGMTLVFALLSLVCWLFTRDSLWGLIGLFDVSTLALMAVQMGVFSRYGAPQAEGLANHVLVLINCSNLTVVELLSYFLARRFSSRRWVAWPYLMALTLCPMELFLIWQGREASALAMCNGVALLMSLWALVVSWMFDVEDRLLRWTCRTLYWVLGLYVLYYLTPVVVRIPPPAALHLYPAIPSNFITMVFSAVMLIRSTQRAQVARLEAERRQLTERELALERRQHEETAGLLSMLLHEIRTPLALIQTATRAIAGGRTPDAASQVKMTQRIDDAVLNISGVLERCIEVDRLEHDRLSPQPVDLNVAELLRQWLMSRSTYPRVQLSEPGTLSAQMDPQLWLSMVANLLQNAVKYSPPDSPIQISLAQQGLDVVLTVRNLAGPAGLPDAARLFQKYYRSNRAAAVSGTGLGLYWVQVLSRRLGGDVHYLPPPANDPAPVVTFTLRQPTRSATRQPPRSDPALV